jgi:hypothetical protein
MHVALKTAGLMILLAYVSDNVAAFFFGANSVFFAVVVIPILEESADPPPLNWSILKYVLRLPGGPKCPRSVASQKRSLSSCVRWM